MSDEDASCFYHPRKKAVVPCAQCGRFLCALCDLELDGRHLCPGCVSAARAAGGRAALQNGLLLGNRTLHDKLALAVAALPLIPVFWLFTVLTAPTALVLAIRYWNEPRQSPLPRGRWRLVAAALLALGPMRLLGVRLRPPVRFFPDHPAMIAADATRYRRLPGRSPVHRLIASLSNILWLGDDHLLHVETAFFQQTYRRFAYGDIQALLLRETPRGLAVNIVLGVLAAGCALIAWSTEGDGWTSRVFVGLAVFWVASFVVNVLRGKTCRCHLQTAAGPHALPSLNRVRPARRAVAAAPGKGGGGPGCVGSGRRRPADERPAARATRAARQRIRLLSAVP